MKRTLLRGRPLFAAGASLCLSAFIGCSDDAKVSGGPGPAVVVDAGLDAPTSPIEEAKDAGTDAELPYEGPAPYDGGPMAPLGVLDLGSVAADTPISFEVPAGTLGFHVMVTSSSPSEALAVRSVQAPSGAFFMQNATPTGGDHPTSETLIGTTATAQVPQSAFSAESVESGTWKVVFTGGTGMRAKIQLQTTPDGVFHGGILNLNVYLPGGLTLGSGKAIGATSAWSRREVKDRITAFFAAIYELYGLRNGTVRFFDVPAKYVSVSEQELGTLFKETKVAPQGQALNIFLSEVDDQSAWWGVAAGIPGAANTPGNDQSGLALASVPQATAEMEGYVLAHEAGHFLGLNHTTEFQGGVADPLPDTPRCTTIDDGNLEACPDFTNIMFPSGAAQPPVVSSASQRRVIHGSPIFRAFTTGTAQAFGATTVAFDYGRLFGHPGVALSRAERLVLAASCGNARPVVRDADRVELARISGGLRGVARRLLTRASSYPSKPRTPAPSP